MNTIVEKIDVNDIDKALILKAASILKQGGLVAFPTETVYGLGANALDENASQKIYGAKGRPSDNPLIIHISKIEDLNTLVSNISQKAQVLMKTFWPGPLTLVFNKSKCISNNITGGLPTVAIRMPSHPIATALIEAAQLPIAAPSANTSGRPSPTSAKHVIDDLEGKVDMIIDGGKVTIGLESTVVDVTGEDPIILRPGFISQSMLEEVIGKVEYDPAILQIEASDTIVPKSPGMKYRHYAPKGQLLIVEGPLEDVVERIIQLTALEEERGLRVGIIASEQTESNYSSGVIKVIGSRDNETEIASRLFEILRDFDDMQVDIIFSETFHEGQLGQAIMNRLLKAAAYQIIYVE